MRNFTRVLVLVASMATLLALSACGTSTDTTGSSSAPTATPTAIPLPTDTATTAPIGAATLKMGASSFVGSTSLHIKAGQAVTFSDPSTSGGVHILVTGTNGTFKSAAGAPSEFSSTSGVSFSPGDTKTITFPTAGTYTITCTIHSFMKATITVA
jgi:plastocyanin